MVDGAVVYLYVQDSLVLDVVLLPKQDVDSQGQQVKEHQQRSPVDWKLEIDEVWLVHGKEVHFE